MEKYTLELPQENYSLEDGEDKWYVGVEENKKMYLRPSMEILDSTGYGEESNVGYWNTYTEALEAKEQYEKKQFESELVFPAYYMYTGEGTGHGDILYCKTKDDCKLVYTTDQVNTLSLGTELNVNDWDEMGYLENEYAECYGLKEHQQGANNFSKNTMKNSTYSIQQEREEDYGDAQESFESIANFWENYLNRKTGSDITIDAIDVALMMTLFKISRNAYKRKEDNFVDGESYANFATRFFEEDQQ